MREGDGELLASLILKQLSQAEEIRERPPKANAENPDRLTRRFTLDIPRFQDPNGSVTSVRTNWALSPEREVPHLASAFSNHNGYVPPRPAVSAIGAYLRGFL